MPDITQGQTPLPTQQYMIIRRTAVGLRDKDGNSAGQRIQDTTFLVSGSDADEALGEILNSLGELSPRLNDISIFDDEYETELACAIDDLKGEFLVFERGNADLGSPLITEGEIGDPTHYENVGYSINDFLSDLATDPVPS